MVCLYKHHIDDNYSDKTCQTTQGAQELCTPPQLHETTKREATKDAG